MYLVRWSTDNTRDSKICRLSRDKRDKKSALAIVTVDKLKCKYSLFFFKLRFWLEADPCSHLYHVRKTAVYILINRPMHRIGF